MHRIIMLTFIYIMFLVGVCAIAAGLINSMFGTTYSVARTLHAEEAPPAPVFKPTVKAPATVIGTLKFPCVSQDEMWNILAQSHAKSMFFGKEDEGFVFAIYTTEDAWLGIIFDNHDAKDLRACLLFKGEHPSFA